MNLSFYFSACADSLMPWAVCVIEGAQCVASSNETTGAEFCGGAAKGRSSWQKSTLHRVNSSTEAGGSIVPLIFLMQSQKNMNKVYLEGMVSPCHGCYEEPNSCSAQTKNFVFLASVGTGVPELGDISWFPAKSEPCLHVMENWGIQNFRDCCMNSLKFWNLVSKQILSGEKSCMPSASFLF